MGIAGMGMKQLTVHSAESATKLGEREYLTSWKEVAQYMGCGVRTVQRYEREFGLPIRRPTGKARGSVMATRAEIDAWVKAAPLRETFELSRLAQDSGLHNGANSLESGVIAMRKLKDQMQALRLETRTALNLLIERVSALRALMPSPQQYGYESLINMNISMDMELDKPSLMDGREETARLGLSGPDSSHKKGKTL
jgi:predicted DNA-binding transcriptional regulator AlpA